MPVRWRELAKSLQLILPAVLAVHGVFLLLWIFLLFVNGPVQTDWSHLKRVADHFVAGDWVRLYAVGPGALHPEYYWLYPPYALFVIAPLAWLSPTAAYATLAGLGAVALGASLVGLSRLLDLRSVRNEWMLAVLCSAPALTMIVTGQISALLALCVVAAAALWTRHRPIAACVVLGLLALKPNWGAFFGLYALVRGEWRGAASMLAVVVALCALAVPLGGAVWRGFFEVSISNESLYVNYDYFKFVTLRSFFDVVLPSLHTARASWVVASVLLVAAATLIWRTRAAPVEHLAATVLLAIAVNPYVQFYDALVLFIPATVWWTQKLQWRRGAWVFIGVLITVAWLWEHAIWTWGPMMSQWFGTPRPGFSLIGPVTAIWLIVWAVEARHLQRLTPGD